MLEAKKLGRSLQSEWIWEELDLAVGPGDRLALCGPTGCGKSLLLRVLAGLDNPDQGVLSYRGRELSSWKLTEYRSEVGYLAQESSFSEGSVEENWRVPFGFRTRRKQEFKLDRMLKWISELGLSPDFPGKNALELSGGERQLAALLRMLQLDPHLLLLDEPTAALDEDTAKLVELLLNQWKRENPERSWIWISHDALQSKRMGDRQFFLGKQD